MASILALSLPRLLYLPTLQWEGVRFLGYALRL